MTENEKARELIATSETTVDTIYEALFAFVQFTILYSLKADCLFRWPVFCLHM